VLLNLLLRTLDKLDRRLVLHPDRKPLVLLQAIEVFIGDARAFLQAGRAAIGHLAQQRGTQTCVDRAFKDAELIVEILLDATDLHFFNLASALVFLDAVAGEHLDIDDGAIHARRHPLRAILHIGRFFAEDRAQQLLFRRQLAFALGRYLADQDVAGAHLGTDVDHTGFIQSRQRMLGHVRDVGGDFLRPQLGVTRNAGQLFDVDGGVTVFLHHTLGDQDRVFEVVAIPRHERDQHVLAQRQFANVGGRAIGQHIATLHPITHVHQRPLVDAGVLVGTGVLDQRIDINARVVVVNLRFIGTHHNTTGIDLIDHAAAQGVYGNAGVARHRALDAGTDQRLLRAQRRHGLALHVRAHQCAVGVIVLQKRNQCGCHRHRLHRRHVHVIDFGRRLEQGFTLVTTGHEVGGEPTLGIELGIGLGNDKILLFDRRQEVNGLGDLVLHHFAVRRLQEAVLVGAGIHCQRVDKANVRAFRRFDGAYTAVMGRMHVAHFETSTLAGQAARPKRRYAALVGDFRQRVVLIHELRQLRGPEELLHRGGNRLGVDQLLRGEAFRLGQRQALLHSALDAHQTDAEHIFGHFTDRAHATIAKMIDIVHGAAAIADFAQHFEHIEDV